MKLVKTSNSIDAMMSEGIASGVFPGAALLVSKNGAVVHRAFYGHATLDPSPEPVTEKTLWDIASLTKPVATASLYLACVREKGLSLRSHAARYLTALDNGDKKKITIRHLLKHTSGLPAWKPYFETIAREHPEDVGKRKCRDYYLDLIAAEPLEAAVSFKKIYSDLGFIVLGILLEDFWEKSLDELFSEKITGPLELKNTFYAPVGAGPPRPSAQFAATEISAWRGGLIRGAVHDDNAYVLGGVAGHAGLFSTVDDLHTFLNAVAEGYRSDHPLFAHNDLMEFVGPKVKPKLGWDAPEAQNSQAGKYFSKNAIGHLGYAGTSLWMDPEKNVHVILLTNRVHPSSKNEAIKQFRPKLHDKIFEELRL